MQSFHWHIRGSREHIDVMTSGEKDSGNKLYDYIYTETAWEKDQDSGCLNLHTN